MAQKDKIKELVGRSLNSYHTKSLQQIDRIEKKNKEQNHKISILSNELDNDYLTKTEEGSVISLEHSKEGMVYLDELQGNTLVNYCTDGSKELTLNGDIDVEGTFVTTTEGVDNGLVDVACEGNTLVNLNKRFNSTQTPSWDATNSDYVVSVKGHTVAGGVLWYYTYLKPSTTYTMVVNILECTNIEDILLDSHYSYPPANMITLKKEVGVQKIVFNTKDSFEQVGPSIKIATYGKDTTNKLKISKHMLLLEGDWTDKEIPPYFEGMKSVGECEDNKIEILSTTNNLLDLSLIDGLVEEGGKIVAKKTINGSNSSLKLKPNTRYKVTMEKYDSNSAWIGFGYKINGTYTFINNTNNKDNRVVEFTTPNERDIIFCAGANGPNDIGHYLRLIKLEYANSSSNSSIAKHNKKEILLNEPLRAVGNVKDKFVKIGNKYFIERNCAEVCLDGSKIPHMNDEWLTENQCVFHVSDITHGKEPNTVISNSFKAGSVINTNQNIECIQIGGSEVPYTNVYVKINKSRLTTVNSEGVKTYLQANPIRLVYILATPTYEPVQIEPVLNTYNDITHISNNSIIPCNMKIKNTGYNAIIKPSTLYTIALDTNKSGTVGMNLGGVKGTTTNNVLKLTTPATLTDDSLRLYGKGIKGSKVRLLEGDKTNWIPSHFEGMKSSFEDRLQDDGSYKMEILSNNENLFSVDDTKLLDKSSAHDIITNSTGYKLISKTDHRGWVYSTFKLPNILKPNTKYTFSCNITKSNSDSKVALRLYRFSDSKDLGLLLKTGSVTFTTPSTNVESIKLLTYTSIDDVPINQDDYVIFENIQISEITSDYTTKEYNKIQFSSIEPLRKWDRFVFKDDKLMIERNSDEFILNGSEHWIIYGASLDGSTNFLYTPKPLKVAKSDIGECDKFVYGIRSSYKECYRIQAHSNDATIEITISNNKLKSVTVEGFKEWLKNNNVKVCRHLLEPTYEEIPFELQKIILEGYENGTLFFDTNIPPTSTVTYAGETPIVKSVKLNKTEVLNNTNDINDNIIPYLMDMDYRVVCLQLQSENINDGVSMARLFDGAYGMLQRDIQSKRYSIDEYKHRLDAYLDANKITEEEYNKLGDMLNE